MVWLAQGGDRRAFAVLWQQHAPTVRAVVATMLPFPQVDDVVQDVAVAAMSKLPMLRDRGGFAGWLCAIARNRARNVLNAAHCRAVLGGIDLDALPAATLHPARSEADEILEHLRALPATYREPLALRFLTGLPGPEIAERLGMTYGSLRVNLCRGMRLLRARLCAERAPQQRRS